MQSAQKRFRSKYGGRSASSAFGAPSYARRRGAATTRRATAMGRIRGAQRGYVRTAGYYGASGTNLELKFHDVDSDNAAIGTAGDIEATINIIPQGITEIERIGRKCTLKAINWRYTLYLADQDAAAVVKESDTARLILYLDTQTNGATAAVLDILETANFQSFNNLVNKGRFQILMDRTEDLNVLAMASDGTGLMSNGANRVSRSFYKKCNIPLEFSADTGALTEMRSNNIGLLAISRRGTVTLDSKFRLRFVG